MTDSRRPFDATQPEPIDDNEDRMGSMEELDFDEEEPSARIGDLMPEDELAHEIPEKRVREAGMTGASTPDHHPTDDDHRRRRHPPVRRDPGACARRRDPALVAPPRRRDGRRRQRRDPDPVDR